MSSHEIEAAVGEEDEVATYLVRNGFLLTALEFHAEMRVEGRSVPVLVEQFEQQLPESFHRSTVPVKAASAALPRSASCIIPTANAQDDTPEVESTPETGALKSRIAWLEFELRKSKEDVESLKKTVSGLRHTRARSASAKRAARDANGADRTSEDRDEDEGDSDGDDEASEFECGALATIIRQWLVDQGYKLSAITLAEEAGSGMVNDEVDASGRSLLPGLVKMYRHYYGGTRGIGLEEALEAAKGARRVQNELTRSKKKVVELKSRVQELERQVGEQAAELSRRKVAPSADAQRIPVPQELEEDTEVKRQDSTAGEGETDPADDASEENGVKENAKEEIETPGRQTDTPGEPLSPSKEERGEEYGEHRRLRRLQLPNVPVIELDESTRIAKEIERIVELEGQPNTGSLIAADCLPHIVPGVILNRREELIPVFLTSIQQHPDMQVRDDLTRLLFNLIRKPNREQRRVIMDGCVALASLIGEERTEIELLPQCWEQITDKFEERRVLVAESCGALVRFVKHALRESLILSILQQLMDDRSPLVRESVARNLAIVVSYFTNPDKYSKVEEMSMRLLLDENIQVISTAQNILLPVVGEWSARCRLLQARFVPMLMGHVCSLLEKLSSGEVNDESASRLQLLVGCVIAVTPRLHELVLSTSPFDVGAPKGISDVDGGSLDSSWFGLHGNNHAVLSEDQLEALKEQVNAALASEDASSTAWDEMKWMRSEFVPKLLSMIVDSDAISNQLVARAVIGLVREVSVVFGSAFAESVVCKAMRAVIESDGKEEDTVHQVKRGRLLPIYLTGALSSLDDRNVLMLELREQVVNVALEEYGWNKGHLPILQQTLSLIFTATSQPVQDGVVELLTRELIVHPALKVRALLLGLYSTLIDCLPAIALERQILPAVITLCNDMDSKVRFASIKTLGQFAINVSQPSVLERVSAQLHLLLDGDCSTELMLEAVTVFGKIIPHVSAHFRDQCILPHLIKLVDKNHRSSSATTKGLLCKCLLDAFCAFSGCIVGSEELDNMILPSLKLLEQDVAVALPSLRPQLDRLLQDLRAQGATESLLPAAVQDQLGFFSRITRR